MQVYPHGLGPASPLQPTGSGLQDGYEFDWVVIGAGGAGLSAAVFAAMLVVFVSKGCGDVRLRGCPHTSG